MKSRDNYKFKRDWRQSKENNEISSEDMKNACVFLSIILLGVLSALIGLNLPYDLSQLLGLFFLLLYGFTVFFFIDTDKKNGRSIIRLSFIVLVGVLFTFVDESSTNPIFNTFLPAITLVYMIAFLLEESKQKPNQQNKKRINLQKK
ncbi:hypothetical protein [Priestia endophytica]|uniref:Uncharacterized protein n=1 Tax=Priestia endophytica DSM 13796 TaxID=1121089 RepID=A0A1I6C087_9BACI|nr:hypothetical protein [Priestia endophytica]KYG33448.1 hypothetical protein AZF06_21630 [Priestia endophytica]SFQ86596.1 hypothetical protein SAMN02745910_04677 [Priestia endophytica DSM 13796]